ncbi:uncharacterized protein Z520_07867 [Fonsecaea multimorphosa CBS 102226]|uniref:Uncharacterized protein n=1 Tax=Fonsecaea multimorphosa CBS 102226 TaxID=1442371 RepID=A0A0D2IHT3_9EURO|nr:uncharacterized protein Z520_07867 [Fonsecaea multimorphosa CBS 102226]KIX96601.1 hypothetical protein Z520_07867 [Fonsecaea multimorphosa CBS 102226]OAL22114.1 hypothetical protein AYO22_07474 [Fonsecaea multimorphosa]
MGGGQRFHLPASLKRTKSKPPNHGWQPEGNEYKVQHLLGITETDFNTVRNQSISSSATAKLPALSFSDATTELGSSHPPTEQLDPGAELNLKASSVLLHEEFLLKADATGSTNPKRLKTYGSSSTINSYYDAHKEPLAVSQQTSESSRRDFALRKGAPVVIKSTTPDKDSLRQLRLFRLSKGDNKSAAKKPTKLSSQSGDVTVKMLSGSQRSVRSPDQNGTTGHLHPGHHSKTPRGVRFQSDHPATSINVDKSKTSSIPPSRQESPYVKMNIRRPKAGAKHWFDGLEGDSSDDESVHEPELHPSFVAGMEMAFEGGRIGLLTNEGSRVTTHTYETSSRGTSSKAPSSHLLPSSTNPARVSILNAKSSRSTLSRNESLEPSSKPKASSLASTDLHKTSILDLSTSEDDDNDDDPRPIEKGNESGKVPLPLLRDSIAVESLAESEIEIGTAKAVSTKQNGTAKATPSLRRVHGTRPRGPASSLSKPSNKRRNHRSTYLSDMSSTPTPEDDDLLTSFPPIPTDQASSHRQSFPESCVSDTASIESRRLMSVTRQEESLLAAIRSKKASLGQPFAGSAADRRIQELRYMNKKSTHYQHPPRTSAALEVQLALQERTRGQSQSRYSDANFDQASCTTFQTGLSTEPSARYSQASFQTGTSNPETEISSSLATFSPTFLAPSNAAVNRMSRSTFFSTSTNSSRDNSRSRRESHYLATLEKLQAPPKREEVSSQDFIDFPYNGWMKLAAAAH